MPETIGTLNPAVKEVQIGVRQLRTINIYPLSVRDQLNAKELVVGTLSTLFKGYETPEEISNEVFISRILDTFTTNLDKLLPMVTDVRGEEDLFADMTNQQLLQIGEVVYEVNYSFLSKLVGKLLNSINPPAKTNEEQSQSSTLLPKSVENMDTSPGTFTD